MPVIFHFLRKPWAAFLLTLVIGSAAAVYVRMYPLRGHIWSDTNEQATLAVLFKIKQTLLAQIHAMNPDLPRDKAEALASAKLNDILRTDNARVRSTIEQAGQAIRDQRGTAHDPLYLLESDPFNFYYLAENILKTGRMAETIQGSQYFHPLMVAPFGFWQPLTLHPYVGFILYKTACLIQPGISLMAAVSFTPLVLCVLGIAAFMWCARLFALSYPAILAGTFFFALAPVYLKRSSLGWFDTDPYNLIFPFLFLGCLFKASQQTSPRLMALWAAALAGTLTLYSLMWQGWVFLFFMTFICAGTAAAFSIIFERNPRRAIQWAVFAGITAFAIAVLCTLLYGWAGFIQFFTEGAGELKKFTVKGMSLWPNLFLEVGELKKSSLSDLLAATGGPVFFLGAAVGLAAGIFRALRTPRHRSTIPIAVTAVFYVIALILTIKAERFVLFMLVPMALFFALIIDTLRERLKALPKGPVWAALMLTLLCGFAWHQGNTAVRTVLTPIFNSTWNTALTTLKKQTPEDSIVNTWWPPGHFIKAIANRRVPFDGASLSEGATGYWIANVLLSTNEDEAAGLLRMLNTTGNRAVEFLVDHGLTTSQAVALIRLAVSQDPSRARETLKAFLGTDDAERLLLMTHSGTPHSYLLIYNELVDANAGLVFAGRRNFQKIETINATPQLLAAVPPPDTPQFIDFMWELSGGPAKFSEPLAAVRENDEGIAFAQGVTVNPDKSSAFVQSPKFGQGIPAGIIYVNNGRLISRAFSASSLNYWIVLYTQDGRPVCRLMDNDLAHSMLVRLFFLEGAGLKHFKPFTSAQDQTGRTQIKVFELVW